MTGHIRLEQLQRQARIVRAPPVRRNRGERTFDLHPAVHLIMVGAYFAFIGILCAATMTQELVVPAAIFFIGVAALFITPALWARVNSDDGLRKQGWAEFMEEGVECLTGRLKAREALAQIMVLPALMVGLALVFAVIRALTF